MLQLRTFGGGGHGDEGALQRAGVARELYGRGIRQVLAATRHRGLDQASGQQSHAAGKKYAERDDLDAARGLAAAAATQDARGR